jgi:hypothetical protein
VITGARSGIEDCRGWLHCQPTKMEEMTELMLAKMNYFQEKIEANQERLIPGYKE